MKLCAQPYNAHAINAECCASHFIQCCMAVAAHRHATIYEHNIRAFDLTADKRAQSCSRVCVYVDVWCNLWMSQQYEWRAFANLQRLTHFRFVQDVCVNNNVNCVKVAAEPESGLGIKKSTLNNTHAHTQTGFPLRLFIQCEWKARSGWVRPRMTAWMTPIPLERNGEISSYCATKICQTGIIHLMNSPDNLYGVTLIGPGYLMSSFTVSNAKSDR